jgi:hypothetical protein
MEDKNSRNPRIYFQDFYYSELRLYNMGAQKACVGFGDHPLLWEAE